MAVEGTSTEFGSYRLHQRLGRGGMAEVFRAVDTRGLLERPVCIKRVLPELAQDHTFAEMLIDEARIAQHLKHEHIVEVLDLGDVDGVLFIAMELVDGCSLKQILKRGPLDARHAVTVGCALASALEFAHRAEADGRPLDIVHRDVSPDNILLSRAGAIKLSDFGVARANERLTKTLTGFTKGKLPYMAPEQAESGAIDHRVDQFAAAVVLWEAMAGRKLFARKSEIDTVRALFKEPIPRLRDVAEVPKALDAAVMRALSRDRERRFPSTVAFGDALAAVLAALGGPADLRPHVAAVLNEIDDTIVDSRTTEPMRDLDVTAPSRPQASDVATRPERPVTSPRTAELPTAPTVWTPPAPSPWAGLATAFVVGGAFAGAVVWWWLR